MERRRGCRLADRGAVRVDEGCLALRSRPAEGGFKPPTGALDEDCRAERCGKSRDRIPAGESRRDERWPQSGRCRLKRRKCIRRHQNQGVSRILGSVWGTSAYRPDGVRRIGSMNPASGSRTEHVNARKRRRRGNLGREGGSQAAESVRDRVPSRARGRTLPSSCEARLIAVGVEPRGGVVQVTWMRSTEREETHA